MNFSDVVKVFKNKYSFEIDENGIDFSDFKGVIINSQKHTFEVEGSVELNNNMLFYSVSFYDVTADKEYDAVIGKITINESTVDEVVDYILCAEFMEILKI